MLRGEVNLLRCEDLFNFALALFLLGELEWDVMRVQMVPRLLHQNLDIFLRVLDPVHKREQVLEVNEPLPRPTRLAAFNKVERSFEFLVAELTRASEEVLGLCPLKCWLLCHHQMPQLLFNAHPSLCA